MEYAAFPADGVVRRDQLVAVGLDTRLGGLPAAPRYTGAAVERTGGAFLPITAGSLAEQLPDTYRETYYEVVSVLDEPLPFTIESDDSGSESFNPNDYSSDRLIRSA